MGTTEARAVASPTETERAELHRAHLRNASSRSTPREDASPVSHDDGRQREHEERGAQAFGVFVRVWRPGRDLSAKYYDFVKKQTPTALSPGIETLEGAIKAYGMPIVTKVQDVAPKVITEADKRVDGVVEGVSSVYTKYTNGENIKAFKKTREEYLKQIEQLLEDIKTKGFQGSVAEVMGFVNTVKETVMKEGAKRVDSAKANPVYVKTYNTVSEKICTAQETALFKKIIAVLEDIKANKSVAPLVNKSVDMATPY